MLLEWGRKLFLSVHNKSIKSYVSVKCLWENKIAKEGQPLLQ